MKNLIYYLIFFVTTIAAQETITPAKKSKLEFATMARCLQKRLPPTASPIAQAIDAEEAAEAAENTPVLSSEEEQSDTQDYEE